MTISIMSGFSDDFGATADGKSICKVRSRFMVRVTIMKAAKRKNITSINGMISTRAFLTEVGDPRCMERNRSTGCCVRLPWSRTTRE